MYASFFVRYDTNSSVLWHYCRQIIVGITKLARVIPGTAGGNIFLLEPYSQDHTVPHLVNAEMELIQFSLTTQKSRSK